MYSVFVLLFHDALRCRKELSARPSGTQTPDPCSDDCHLQHTELTRKKKKKNNKNLCIYFLCCVVFELSHLVFSSLFIAYF